MALTTLDPKTALIVVDLQKGLLGYPTLRPIQEVVVPAVALLQSFRWRGLPVVLVRVAGAPSGRTEEARGPSVFPPDFAELLPELDVQPQDHLVTKRARSAFADTGLDAWLKGQGVTQVVIAGVSTSAGVESTARQAYDHGFHVTLAVDAMTDTSAEAHRHSLTRIFPRLGETGTAAEIISLLDRTAA